MRCDKCDKLILFNPILYYKESFIKQNGINGFFMFYDAPKPTIILCQECINKLFFKNMRSLFQKKKNRR